MAKYEVYKEQKEVYGFIHRLCQHHDHLKNLVRCYNYMRQEETYAKMQDPKFRCEPEQMAKLDSSYFTSLIVRLSYEHGKSFFDKVSQVYSELKEVVKNFYPHSEPEIYLVRTEKCKNDRLCSSKNILTILYAV